MSDYIRKELLQKGFIDSELRVDMIAVRHRHRQDLGDIVSLARSIESLGLLHPLVVDMTGCLIAGRRRLEAVRELKWEFVPVHFVKGLDDALLALQAERDENTCRKDFTPSEAVAIGKALEDLEKPKAKQRQAQRLKKGNATPVVENCHNGESNGKTRDKVAEAVGMSGRTYEKAKKVVDAAEQEPEQFGPVKDEMDRTGKVDPAHQKVQEKRGDRAAKAAETRRQREEAERAAAKRREEEENPDAERFFNDLAWEVKKWVGRLKDKIGKDRAGWKQWKAENAGLLNRLRAAWVDFAEVIDK